MGNHGDFISLAVHHGKTVGNYDGDAAEIEPS